MKILKTLSFLLVATLALSNSTFACPDIDGLVDLNCDGRIKILTFGDSITYGEQDSEHLGYPGRLILNYFPTSALRNFGKSGETTRAGRIRAANVFSKITDSDYVILLEGVNDYYESDHSTSSSRSNLLSIVKSARKTGAVVLLGNLIQTRRRTNQIRWVKSLNSRISRDKDIDFFSLGSNILSSDRIHPNNQGYQLMAELLAPKLISTSLRKRPLDSDHDGVYNYEESRYGTNRYRTDTDNDGLSDFQEIFTYQSNPNNSDTDEDGISDSEEVANLGNPNSKVPQTPQVIGIKVD